MCEIGNAHCIPQDTTLHYVDWALALFGIHGPDVPLGLWYTPVSDPSFDIFGRFPQNLWQPANIFS